MPIDIDLSLIKAAAVGAVAGAVITSIVLLFLHRRRMSVERSQESIDRPTCLWSISDPLNGGIVRVSRKRPEESEFHIPNFLSGLPNAGNDASDNGKADWLEIHPAPGRFRRD